MGLAGLPVARLWESVVQHHSADDVIGAATQKANGAMRRARTMQKRSDADSAGFAVALRRKFYVDAEPAERPVRA